MFCMLYWLAKKRAAKRLLTLCQRYVPLRDRKRRFGNVDNEDAMGRFIERHWVELAFKNEYKSLREVDEEWDACVHILRGLKCHAKNRGSGGVFAKPI